MITYAGWGKLSMYSNSLGAEPNERRACQLVTRHEWHVDVRGTAYERHCGEQRRDERGNP